MGQSATGRREMSPTAVNPRDFGALEKSVEHLSKSVEALTEAVTELSSRIGVIENRYTLGRGMMVGLVIAAALSVYGASELIDKLLGIVAK